jgi:SAM-dependent methyltransferase
MMPVEGDQQLRQLEHRQRVLFSQDLRGSRVLEIGCGQGDMTLVLANAVGENGSVLAIDSARGDYGAPRTLAESQRALRATPLGSRIEFRLETTMADLSDQPFDWVILAHCSWYMRPAEWDEVVRSLPRFGNRLVFAEWDLDDSPASRAVRLQARVAERVPEFQLNVRMARPFAEMGDSLVASGWELVHERALDTSALMDGRWEIENTRNEVPTWLNEDWVLRELAELEGVAEVRSLPAKVAEFRRT